MKKRLLALCLTLCLLVGLLPTTALATGDTVWTDEVTEQPAGYTVESSGDVTISSAEGLAWLAQQVNEGISFSGKTITLSENIDLSAHEWVPIGTQAHPFDGTFDGGNYQISGMNITVSGTKNIAGLFGVVSTATIKNVKLTGATISGSVTGTKLHAQYCAPQSWAKARAHEVFAHHVRLPRRGEKMAHLAFCYAFA